MYRHFTMHADYYFESIDPKLRGGASIGRAWLDEARSGYVPFSLLQAPRRAWSASGFYWSGTAYFERFIIVIWVLLVN